MISVIFGMKPALQTTPVRLAKSAFSEVMNDGEFINYKN